MKGTLMRCLYDLVCQKKEKNNLVLNRIRRVGRCVMPPLGPLFFTFAAFSQSSVQGAPAILATAAPAGPDFQLVTPYAITDQGPHHRLWQKVLVSTNAPFGPLYLTNSYTELATGMNHLVDGQWVPSSSTIQITQAGAAATNMQHQVYFLANLNTVGAVDLVTPDAQHMRSHIMGLAYYDASSSNSVLFAQLQDSYGQVSLSQTQALYTNAFAGCQADVIYTSSQFGLEQDVVLREQPPSPTQWGLNPQTTWLQIWTEFTDFPTPVAQTITNAFNGLQDDELQFGSMCMGHGKAFMIGQERVTKRINKHWRTIQGRTFLVEEVPLNAIASHLQNLPAGEGSSGSTNSSLQPLAPGGGAADALRRPPADLQAGQSGSFLAAPPSRGQPHSKVPMRFARAASSEPGYVLDYQILNSTLTNYTFRSDMTYFINGTVYVYGTTTIEGGTVIKYTNDPSASIIGATPSLTYTTNWVCKTDLYRPAIFCAMDDDSIGAQINGSAGSPSGYYGGTALEYDRSSGGTVVLKNLRFSNLQTAADLEEGNFNLYNVQFIQCGLGVHLDTVRFYMGNALFEGGGTNFYCVPEPCYATLENLTVDCHGSPVRFCNLVGYESYPWDNPGGDGPDFSMSIVNTLFSALGTDQMGLYAQDGTDPLVPLTDTVFSSGSSDFQSAGGGNYYLYDNTHRGQGTSAIDATLLSEMPHLTTYPPLTLNTNITVNTTISPAVPRDTNSSLDLGYHYPAMDFIDKYCQITNSTLTLTNGVVLGYYDVFGLWLENRGQLVSQGSPALNNYIVHCHLVQEQPTNLWSWSTNTMATAVANCQPIFLWSDVWSNYPSVSLQFTTISAINGESGLLWGNDQASGFSSFSLTNCEIYAAGSVWAMENTNHSPSFALKNNLFHRPYGMWSTTKTAINTINNLFVGTTNVEISFWSGGTTHNTNFNNAFDGCTVYMDYNHSNNAYLNGTVLQMTAETNCVTTNFTWLSGPLGWCYQPTNSPLIDHGNTSAGNLGLYQYTTQTNQTIESNSIVDIGYHYVALNSNNQPLDVNSNGAPDYIENPAGPVPPYILKQPDNVTIAAGATATFTVIAAGPAPLSYQWYYNSTTAISGGTGSALVLNAVGASQAGNYSVVVTGPGGSTTSSNGVLAVISPKAVSGLRLWLNGSMVSNNSTGLVSAWLDQSGNGYKATNSISTQEPTIVSNAIAGYPVVHFSGSNAYLQLPDVMPSTNATGGEAFAVLRTTYSNAQTDDQSLWYFGNGGGFPGTDASYPDVYGGIRDAFGCSHLQFLGIPAQPLTNYHVYNVSSATNYWAARINGVLLFETNRNTVFFPNNPKIGNDYPNYFTGDIAEIVIFNHILSSSDRDTIQNYFTLRYGLVQAPAVPTGFAALAISSNQVSLTWDYVLTSTNLNVKIERSATNTNSFTQVGLAQQAGSYIDTGLNSGVTYYYRIKGSTYGGDSAYSITVSATPVSGQASFPLTNVVTWLKSDAGNGGPGKISFLVDQSGNSNDAFQFTEASGGQNFPYCPVITTNAINGRPALYFTNDTLYLFPNAVQNLTSGEIIAVVNPVVNSSNILWEFGMAGGTEYPAADGNIYDDFGNMIQQTAGAPISSIYAPHIYDAYSSPGDWAARVDGVAIAETNQNDVEFNPIPEFGSLNNTPQFNGYLAEVLLFDRKLSDAERNAVNVYLAGKYGITNSLPPSPTNFVATGISPVQISLHASGPLANVGWVTVERKVGSAGTYSLLGTLSNPAANSFIDTIASSTAAYYYRLTSYNDAGFSSPAVIAPPTAAITSPANSTPLSRNTNFTATVSASALNGTLSNVVLYNASNPLGTLTSGPYTFTVSTTNSVYFALMAKAADSLGNSRFSQLVSLPVYTNTSSDGRNDGWDIALGWDPTNTNNIPFNPSDTNAPVINLLQPANATFLP